MFAVHLMLLLWQWSIGWVPSIRNVNKQMKWLTPITIAVGILSGFRLQHNHTQFLSRSVYFILDREITKFDSIFFSLHLFPTKLGTRNG